MKDDANISIKRLFQILELFQRERRPLTASTIQQLVDCPRSSLNLLLKSLINLDYLTLHRKSNAYFPSVRLEELTAWILPSILQDHCIGESLERLKNRTGETVVLSMRSDMEMEVIRVATSTQAIALRMACGSRIPIWSTAVGCAMLASLAGGELKRLYFRARQSPKRSLNEIRAETKLIQERGFAVSYGAVLEGVGALAAALPVTFSGRELVISVGGPSERIAKKEQQLGAILCAHVTEIATRIN
ncbi:helix-turn-helix domain-containing protein [Exilibacterium tricleocarpae]|uniref:Helix-turn-helix domain-containing protein n=1 Tax=Exilibacterium tricleocarpae TaxID=2591008 RepID=A0A545U9Q1_9GAMM|nr:helix-turn-helix domain-containing protein [Exilibacterium tricleocarpae]TQV86198.1 helix-turn-helix domain-containing protein [Exilibacterium tricleocarpae]